MVLLCTYVLVHSRLSSQPEPPCVRMHAEGQYSPLLCDTAPRSSRSALRGCTISVWSIESTLCLYGQADREMTVTSIVRQRFFQKLKLKNPETPKLRSHFTMFLILLQTPLPQARRQDQPKIKTWTSTSRYQRWSVELVRSTSPNRAKTTFFLMRSSGLEDLVTPADGRNSGDWRN